MKEIFVTVKDKDYILKSRLGEVDGLKFNHQFSQDPELAFLTYIDSIDEQPVMRLFKVENDRLYDYAITSIKMIRYTGDLKEIFDKQKSLLKQEDGTWKHFGKPSIQNRLKKIDGYYLDQVDEILGIDIDKINNQIFSDLTGVEDYNLRYLPKPYSNHPTIFQQEAENAKELSFNNMDLHYMYLSSSLDDFKQPFYKDYMSLGFKVFSHEFIDFLNFLNRMMHDYESKPMNEVLNHRFDSKGLARMVIEICDDNSGFMVPDETFNVAFLEILYLDKMFDDKDLLNEILDEYLYPIILHEVNIAYTLEHLISDMRADTRLIEVLDKKEQELAYFYVIQNTMDNIHALGYENAIGPLITHIYRLLFDVDTKEEKEIKERHEFPDLKSYIDYYIPPNIEE